MGDSQPHAFVAAVIVGVALAATGILADDLFSHRLRVGMVVLGCCALLAAVAAL